jgi:hypothetical protein
MVLGAALLAGAPSLHAQSGQPVRGDVDGDGRVTAADARIVSDFLVGKPVPAGANVRERGDVNGDGRVTSVDAAIIARAAAGRDVSRFPVGTPVADDPNALARLTCQADLSARTMSCDDPRRAAGPGGPRALIAGGVNGQYVQITWNDLVVTTAPGDTTFSFDVRVQNLIPQSIGTVDNVSPDVDSVRVFFNLPPVTTGPGNNGNITVAAPTTAFLNHGVEPYYQFPGFLANGAMSPERRFHFDVHGLVTTFKFEVKVSAAVQYPAGWVDIYRPDIPPHAPSPYVTYADTLLVGEVDSLRSIVRNAHGDSVTAAPPVGWVSSDTVVARVGSGTGVVTADSVGTTLLTATSNPQRIGHFSIVVTAPSADSSTITASSTTVAAGDTSLITVQVRDGFGRLVTTGGDAVELSTAGASSTLTTDDSTATTVIANDNGDGTYTAKLRGTTTGTATVTGKLNGVTIVDNAVVNVTAAPPASIEKVEPLTKDSVNLGSPITPAPRVRVKDGFGNPVSSVLVTYAASAGSSVTPPSQTTNGSGEATVTNWTINTAGDKTLTVKATGVTDSVVFKAYGNMAPLAGRDSIDAIGNVQVTASGLLANDSDPELGTLKITPYTGPTLGGGGTVEIDSVGGVVYNSVVGFTGMDSVSYTVKDNRGSPATGKLIIRVPNRFWYVQGGGSGNGTRTSPSGNFTFGAALAAKDSIFLLSTATVPSGVTLPNGGALIGTGAANIVRTLGHSPGMTVDDVTLLTNGGSPTLTVSAGTGVSLTAGGSGYIVKGLALATSNGAAISGSNFGALDLGTNELSINATGGAALSLSIGALSGALTSMSASGGANNVVLTSVTTGGGTVNLGTSGALSGASGDAVKIDNGNGSFSYAGTVTSTAGPAVNVINKTGGTVTFSGAVSSSAPGAGVSVASNSAGTVSFSGSVTSSGTGISVASNSGGAVTFSGDINPAAAAAGISVANNTGGTFTFSGANKKISSGTASGVSVTGNAAAATIAFTNGGLTIASTTGTPFTATGAGTVEVSTGSGSSNTISVTGAAARAVNLNGVTIPAGGISFASIVSTGSTTASAFTAISVASSGGGGFTAGLLKVAGTTGGTSRGMELTTNSAPFTFTADSVNGTGGEGIYLNGNIGAVAINGGAVGNTSSTAGDALFVTGGNAGVTVAASLTKSTAGRVANISSHTAGNVTVSGSLSCTGTCTGLLANGNSGGTIDFTSATQSLSTGASAAVSLTSNSGSSINFTGGALTLSTGAGTGFNATGGGTVTVQGANNSVNSNAGGTAVNISSTTIGGLGVTFKSVNATGSGTNGIVLSGTGAGPFTVTGDGNSDPNNTTRGRTTAREGGGSPLTLGSGGSISGRSGHGVSLATTGAVTLRNMVITGSASSGDGINATSTGRLTLDNLRITGHASDHGILGSTVSGLALHHSEVDNNATTVGVVEGPDIWNIRLLGLTGTDSIRNSNIHHSQENVMGIINTSGVLNLTVSNTNITDTGTGGGGGSDLIVAANGSSNVTLNLQNDSILRGRGRGVQTSTETAASAVLNLTVNNSQFLQNGLAIENAHGSSGTNTFSITGNNVQAGAGSLQAININRLGSPSFNAFGLFTGTISGNTIGTVGTPNSGSDTGSGIEVESNGSGGITRVAVVNNIIREVATFGIYVAEVDANIGGTAQPLMEARVAGNTISNMEAVGLDGIHILPGALNTDDLTMCIDIANNNSTGIRNGLRVRPSGLPAAPSTVQLEGWDGVTAVNTYFTSRPNTLAGGVAAISTTAPPAPGGFFAVANCNTP